MRRGQFFGLVFHNVAHQHAQRFTVKGSFQRHQFVAHASKRPHVGRGTVHFAFTQFGGQVIRCANGGGSHCLRQRRHTEITQFYQSFVRSLQQDVLGFEVPMDDF